MTKDDEARVLAMLDAFENGKRVADLDEVEVEKADGALIEVTDSDGESRRASLGTLLQATDAKERLDKTDESIDTLTGKVDSLIDSTTVRRWTSEKMPEFHQGLWVLSEETGAYYKSNLCAPMWSEDESKFDEACTLTPDGVLSRVVWGGDFYIPGSEDIRKGDIIYAGQTYYYARGNAWTLPFRDQSYRVIEVTDGNDNRYVFTSAPCRDMDHFIVISYEDYIASDLGKVGLVVRMPGLFCTDAAQYVKDAGLIEVDYNNGCFMLLNFTGRRFDKWPNPIHFAEGDIIHSTQKEGLTYKRCKGWTTGVTRQNKRVKLDIEVSIGDTLGYRVGNNNSYTLFPFVGEDPDTAKLCRAGIRYMELPFGYAPSQLGDTVALYTNLSNDPLYGKYDERNVTLVGNLMPSGVKCPDTAFFPGSTLRIKSPRLDDKYNVNLKVIDRDADFVEKLCPTRQYYGMEPQSARFRAEVTFNDGKDQLEGIAVFTVRPRGRMVNRAYSPANSPNTSLDVDTAAIEGKEFYLYSDLSGLKKVLRLWQYFGNEAAVTNDRLLGNNDEPIEVDGHEIYRVAYHPTYYVLPEVGYDGMVPRENPQEDDYAKCQRMVELWQYKAGDYVEFVQPDGSAFREMITFVDYESGMILIGSGEALLLDANNPVTGFHNISDLGSAIINQLIGKCVIIGYRYLPWSDASRDDGGQLKQVGDVSGFRGKIASISFYTSDSTVTQWSLEMFDPDGSCISNHVAWTGDQITLYSDDDSITPPVTLDISGTNVGSSVLTIAGLNETPMYDESGGCLYTRFLISRPSTYENPQRYATMNVIEGSDWVIIPQESGMHSAIRRWEQRDGTAYIPGWNPGTSLIRDWQTGSSVEYYVYGLHIGALEARSEVVTPDTNQRIICSTGYLYELREIANPRIDGQSRHFDFSGGAPDGASLAAVRVGDSIQIHSDSEVYTVTEIRTDDAWQQLKTYTIIMYEDNGAEHDFSFYPNTSAPSWNGMQFPIEYIMIQNW